MQKHITKFGAGLYLFTATPAIEYGRRDLRKRFPHSQFGTMREFVQEGILSPIQLFTYRAGPEANSATNMAISQAVDFLRKGLKTLVVCQPGEHLKQAREITARINALYRRTGFDLHPRFDAIDDDEIACTIGSDPSLNSNESIEHLRRGKRLVITTVATGNEGLDIVDLDALVIIGPQGAQWMVDQWLGRVLRPSGRLAVAIEILPYALREGKPLASIFSTFGMEDKLIISGHYIGPRHTDERREPTQNPRTPALSWPGKIATNNVVAPDGNIENQPDTLLDTPCKQPHEKTPATQITPELYSPPEELQSALLDNIPVREATIAPADLAKMPPAGYKPLDLDLPEGVPEEWLYAILAKQTDPEIRYIGVWERAGNDELQYVRYYSPAAHQYFREHPISELVGHGEYLDEEIAAILGVGRSRVQAIIEKLGLQHLPKITKYHRKPKYYDMAAFAAIAEEIAKIPRAAETDIPVREFGEELGITDIHAFIRREGITALEKHRNPTWGTLGVCTHITENEANFLREVRSSAKDADPDLHIGMKEIAQRAGMSLSNLSYRFAATSPEEQPLIEWLRASSGMLGIYVRRSWGEAFIEHIKPEKVLPWEVPLTMLASYFGRQKQYIRKLIAADRIQIPLPGVKAATVFPLLVIPKLIKCGLQPIPGAPPVNAELAATSADDLQDDARITYSQMVQAHFLPAEHIPARDEIEYYLRRRIIPPAMPNLALSIPTSPGIAGADKGKGEHQPTSHSHARTRETLAGRPHAGPVRPVQFKTKTAPSLRMPDNYVNIHSFLADHDVACAPSLLPMVARQNHIDIKQWVATNKGPWSSQNDADTLVTAIGKYSIAPVNNGDPDTDRIPVYRLAAAFPGRQTNLSEGDVHKVARRILQESSPSVDLLIIPLRLRQTDGTGGPLMAHYTKRIADLVRAKLEKLEELHQLASIRCW